MPASPQNPGLLNWVLISILGVVWGSAFMSMSLALEGYSPLSVATYRVLLGAIVLVGLGRMVGQPVSKIWTQAGVSGLRYAFGLGILTVAAPFLFLTWGLQFVPSAFAGVAMGALPVLILPLVYVFAPDEGIGPRRIIGVLMGFAGLLVLIGPNAWNFNLDRPTAFGQLACFGAVGCYAVGSIITRRAPKMPPISFAAGTLVAGAMMLVPLALIKEGLPHFDMSRATLALLYLALMPTGLAAVIRLSVITTAGSVFMSLTNFQVPVWAVIFGIVLLDEALPPQLFAGLALILTGIAIAQSRALQDLLFPKR
ncbi:MAG: DMT family transporter [Pseudomonadota bacterium]